MSKFLFAVWPFPGDAFPNIAIAHVLKEYGHEVAFYTGSRACAVIREEGFLCFPFKNLNEENLYQVVFSDDHPSPLRLKRLSQFKTILRKWLIETIPNQIDDLENVVKEWQPDVLICNPHMWGPSLIMQHKQPIKVAIASLAVGCMLPGSDVPPFGLGLPPPRGWLTKMLTRLMGIMNSFFTKDFRRAADAIRKQYNLPPLGCSVIEFTGKVPLYIVPSIPELDYMRKDLPPSVHYVGPYLWSKLRNHPTPDWLEKLPGKQPWVHVTEGTVHVGIPVVLRAAAQGLANLPMQVIMTTGGNRAPEDLNIRPIASNIHLANWISHSDLLPRIDVLVTTGGASTIFYALKAGVPMVVVPTDWDKPENARRVVEAGAGLQLPLNRCTPERLRTAVERVLSDPSYRQNAQRLAASFNRYGGAEKAAELLMGLCAQPVKARELL